MEGQDTEHFGPTGYSLEQELPDPRPGSRIDGGCSARARRHYQDGCGTANRQHIPVWGQRLRSQLCKTVGRVASRDPVVSGSGERWQVYRKAMFTTRTATTSTQRWRWTTTAT